MGDAFDFESQRKSVSLERAGGESRIISANESKSMTFTTVYRQYEIIQRNQFTSHWDFKACGLGATISFMNIWLFPGLAYHVKSGLLIIPYIVWTLVIGLPLITLEMFLGQISGVGIARTLGLMTPVFAGLGWGTIIITFYKALQVSMLLSYCIVYLFNSFHNKLDWATCGNEWNTNECCDSHRCNETTSQNKKVSPAYEYFYRFVMDYKPNIKDRNEVSYPAVLAQFVGWLVVFFCLLFGLKITSKVAYVTCVLPYVGLLMLFIDVLTLEGAIEGMGKFFENAHVLGDVYVKTWSVALLLSVWTLNIGLGVWTAMTSYNPFHNNCQRDALIIVIVDIVTCLLSGLTVFGGANHLAHEHHIPFQNISDSAYSLSFVIFPEILSHMQAAPFFSVAFFFCQCGLILDGLLWTVETILTEISDVYQPCREGKYRLILVAIICLTCFGLSIGFCLKGSGIIIVLSLDKHTNYWCLTMIIFMEVFVVIYVYGYDRFSKDISLILGCKPNIYYRFTWQITAPLMIVILSILLAAIPPTQFRGAVFPAAADQYGWLLSTPPLICIFAFALYRFVKNHVKGRPIYFAVLPRKRWCPRKKSNLAAQRAQIDAAMKGLMTEYNAAEAAESRSIIGGKKASSMFGARSAVLALSITAKSDMISSKSIVRKVGGDSMKADLGTEISSKKTVQASKTVARKDATESA